MNILSILKGIENLATELLLWIVYIPKTLFKIIKDPFWVRKYVNAELEKDHKFMEYMSPIMLYLATSVILYVLHDMIGSTGKDDPMGKLQGFGLLFLALPLMVALIIEWFRRAPFSRALILRSLYIQCYFLSPLMLAIFAFALSESSFWSFEQTVVDDWSAAIKDIPIYLLALTAIWFIIIEVKFIANDLKMNRFQSFGILIACITLLILGSQGFIFLSDKTVDYNGINARESANFTIKADGSYYVVVREKNNNLFDFHLSLIDVKNKDDFYGMAGEALRYGQPFTKVSIKIGQSIVGRELNFYTIDFDAKKGQNLNIVLTPLLGNLENPESVEMDELPSGPDLSFNVHEAETYKSVLSFGTKWIKYVRIIYVLMFSYAVFFGYRAFFIYRKRRKAEKRAGAQQEKANE